MEETGPNLDEIKGETKINRPPEATETKRRAEKLVGKSTWFKKQRNKAPKKTGMRKPGATHTQRKTNCQVEGVMFIPYTPYSALKKELAKVEDMVNGSRLTGKIRFVERAGPRIRDLICSKTPWKQEWCQREGCAPCKQKPGSCRKLNITYQITCTECTKTGKEVHYFGETSRTW